jgi:hypothetical protein
VNHKQAKQILGEYLAADVAVPGLPGASYGAKNGARATVLDISEVELSIPYVLRADLERLMRGFGDLVETDNENISIITRGGMTTKRVLVWAHFQTDRAASDTRGTDLKLTAFALNGLLFRTHSAQRMLDTVRESLLNTLPGP